MNYALFTKEPHSYPMKLKKSTTDWYSYHWRSNTIVIHIKRL